MVTVSGTFHETPTLSNDGGRIAFRELVADEWSKDSIVDEISREIPGFHTWDINTLPREHYDFLYLVMARSAIVGD